MIELTRFEEQILLSVWKLQNEAYGLTIYRHIKELTGKDMAIGGIYFPLERLVKKGFLTAYQGEPTAVRGGQSKRYYKLTKSGLSELIKTRETQAQKVFESAISKKENLKDAFDVTADVQGKKILLIDDIFDSGQTIKTIGLMLKHKGVAEVAPITIAKTVGGR